MRIQSFFIFFSILYSFPIQGRMMNIHDIQVDTIIPTYDLDLGDGFSLQIKASIALGSHGQGIGLNATTTYRGSKGSLSAGIGGTYYFSEPGTKKPGFETRIYGGGALDFGAGFGLGYYQTQFLSGETSQRVGNVITTYKDWSFTFENDYIGDFRDRFRTHASVLKYKDFSMGINLFSGEPGDVKDLRRIIEDEGKYGTYLLSKGAEDPNKYRLGILFFGYNIFRIGTNSEHVRHLAQNRLIHDNAKAPQFEVLDQRWKFYGGIYTFNPFTAW